MNKLEKQTEILLDWQKGIKHAPFSLHLFPTNKCNLKCMTCSLRGKEPYEADKEVSKAQYVKLTNEAGKYGVQRIVITGGGEPLARYDTTKAITKVTKKHNMEGTLITNGTLFKEDLIKQLVEIGWDYVQISLDGPDSKTQDFLRGKGTFRTIMKNIKLFNHWKSKLSKNLPEVELIPVVNSKNFDKLSELLILANKNNIRHVTFQSLRVPDNKESRKLILSKTQYKLFWTHVKKAKELAFQLEIITNLENLDKKIMEETSNLTAVINHDIKEQSKQKQDKLNKGLNKGHVDTFKNIACYQPWIEMIIKPDGLTGPCPPVADNLHLNIKNNTLAEIWTSKQMEEFRKGIITGNIPECCERCCGNLILENREIRKNVQTK